MWRSSHGRKIPACRTCNQPVRGHIGRPGISCRNRSESDLPVFQYDLPDINIQIMDDAVNPEKESSLGNPEPVLDNDRDTLQEIRDITKGIEHVVGELGDRVKDLRIDFDNLRQETSDRMVDYEASRRRDFDGFRREVVGRMEDFESRNTRSSADRYSQSYQSSQNIPSMNRSIVMENQQGAERSGTTQDESDRAWPPPPELEINTPLRNIIGQPTGACGGDVLPPLRR